MAGRAAGGALGAGSPLMQTATPAARRGLCSYRNKERGFAMRYVAVAVCCLGLAGCDGSSPDTACQVLDPPPVLGPTAEHDQRVEMQATGDPTVAQGGLQDCPD